MTDIFSLTPEETDAYTAQFGGSNCAQIRAAKIDDLKTTNNCLSEPFYVVEILDGSFHPIERQTRTFLLREEADAYYEELVRQGRRTGFLRKYAVVRI